MLIAEKKKYTVDDYMMMEEGAPFQLINYDLIMSPSPTPIHQAICIRLSQIILNFLDSTDNGGVAFAAPMDVKFDDGNVLQPDVLYISEQRRSELVKDRIEGAPDLVIEVLSPSNAYYDLRQKKDIYQKYGVKEYIIVDPIALNSELYILQDGVYQLHQKAEKTEQLQSVLLPGLSFDLSKIFA
ncbi:Uma2 family endonuclease [Mucilaginibacter sp. McL0603]|uniref:Uma2 family endonuclease n=1 Tax=Mucilaginibacter sp. McL0603 TaxID=3415670 RepID=UPI003CE93CBD